MTGTAYNESVSAESSLVIELLYFAAIRELVGVPRESIELADPAASVADLVAWLESNRPSLRGHLPKVRFAVGDRFVESTHQLRTGDVVALIPPVSGG
jgi:molybdopterin converting factor subunit 1